LVTFDQRIEGGAVQVVAIFEAQDNYTRCARRRQRYDLGKRCFCIGEEQWLRRPEGPRCADLSLPQACSSYRQNCGFRRALQVLQSWASTCAAA
jgi:hypothetical protein